MAARRTNTKARRLLETSARKSKSKVGAWFGEEENREAEGMVSLWLTMRAKGETDWSMDHLHVHLQEEHRLPFSKTTFYGWVRNHRTDEYRAAIARIAEEQG